METINKRKKEEPEGLLADQLSGLEKTVDSSVTFPNSGGNRHLTSNGAKHKLSSIMDLKHLYSGRKLL